MASLIRAGPWSRNSTSSGGCLVALGCCQSGSCKYCSALWYHGGIHESLWQPSQHPAASIIIRWPSSPQIRQYMPFNSTARDRQARIRLPLGPIDRRGGGVAVFQVRKLTVAFRQWGVLGGFLRRLGWSKEVATSMRA